MIDEVFAQSLQCLRFHAHLKWGDRSLLDVFNRLVAKHIRPSGWTPFTHATIQPHQIKSRREVWTTSQLAPLRKHGDKEGEDFPCPIVIAVVEGEERLLDGNHRINRWVDSANADPHDVNIHVVEGSISFTEYSPG